MALASTPSDQYPKFAIEDNFAVGLSKPISPRTARGYRSPVSCGVEAATVRLRRMINDGLELARCYPLLPDTSGDQVSGVSSHSQSRARVAATYSARPSSGLGG